MELLATEEEEMGTIVESEEQQLLAMELLATEEEMETVEGEIDLEDGEMPERIDSNRAKASTSRLLRTLAEEVREAKEVIENMKSRLRDSDFDASTSIENMKTRLRDIDFAIAASDPESAMARPDDSADETLNDFKASECSEENDDTEGYQSSSYSKTVKIQLSDLILEEGTGTESDGVDIYQEMLLSSIGEGREDHVEAS